MIPLQSLLMWLLQASKLSEPGRDILEVTVRSGLRTRANWLVPFLATTLSTIALLFFRFSPSGFEGFGTAFSRIFIFDYLLFIFAWVSGWNMSRRWRENSDLVDELTLTNMRPHHTTVAMCSGVLGSWFYCLLAFAIVEIPIYFGSLLIHAGSDYNWSPATNSELIFEAGIFTVAMVPMSLMLAWFHFESVKFAHSMFALGAMPRVPLGRMALSNFFAIGAYVALLSGVGCVVTGVFAMPIFAVGALLAKTSSILRCNAVEELAWLASGFFGLWAVILLKRKMATLYQSTFNRRWAMFQWWGAAEIDHPVEYPMGYARAADLWSLYNDAMEAREAPGFTAREVLSAESRYQNSLNSAGKAVAPSMVTPSPRVEAPERMN